MRMFQNKEIRINEAILASNFSDITKYNLKYICNDYTSVPPATLSHVIKEICKRFNLNDMQSFNEQYHYLRLLKRIEPRFYKLNFGSHELLIEKESCQDWSICDWKNKRYVGFINSQGIGNLNDSTKIAIYLQKEYIQKGIGTAVLKRYLNEVSPDGDVFEAMGMKPGSLALIKKLGFVYNPDSLSYMYKTINHLE